MASGNKSIQRGLFPEIRFNWFGFERTYFVFNAKTCGLVQENRIDYYKPLLPNRNDPDSSVEFSLHRSKAVFGACTHAFDRYFQSIHLARCLLFIRHGCALLHHCRRRFSPNQKGERCYP